MAIAQSSSAWRSRATTCVEIGSPRVRADRAPALESWVGRSVGADGPGHGADCGLRKGSLQALGIAVGLEREPGELDPECGRLSVHAVGPTGAEGECMFTSPGCERLHEGAGSRQDDLASGAQL